MWMIINHKVSVTVYCPQTRKKKKKSKIKLDLSSEAERCTGMSVNHKMDLPISKRSGNNENPDRVLQFTHPTSLHCVWLELGLSH